MTTEVSPEVKVLLNEIATATNKLTQAKRILEEIRKLGVDAEQNVTYWREKLHEAKDKLTAIEGATK